jgi:AcrR family transcriptional regulator
MAEIVKGTKKYETQQRILNAAKMHFLDFGFKDTLISDIAHYCHIDRRTIYRYFPSKEHLLIHICADSFDEFVSKVVEFKFDEQDDVHHKMRKLLGFYYQYLTVSPDFILFLGMIDVYVGTTVYNRDDYQLLNQHGQRLDKVLEKVIQEGQDSGLMKRKYSARDYAITINNSLNALATRTAIYTPYNILKHEGYTWKMLEIQGNLIMESLLVK